MESTHLPPGDTSQLAPTSFVEWVSCMFSTVRHTTSWIIPGETQYAGISAALPETCVKGLIDFARNLAEMVAPSGTLQNAGP